MPDYVLEFEDRHGIQQTTDASTANAALDKARNIAPGMTGKLSDETGEICRFEKMTEAAVWQID